MSQVEPTKVVGFFSRERLLGAAVGGATFFAHLPCLDGEILGWDDRRALMDFTQWRGLGLSNLSWAFTTTSMAIYRPLTWLSYGLDYVLSGLDPSGFHRTNLIVHVATSTCLYVFILRWLTRLRKQNGGLTAAVLTLAWAIHPMRVQAVAWLSARADLLASLFFVAASVAWLAWISERSPRMRLAWHLLFVASLLSKPVALGAPLVWAMGAYWLMQQKKVKNAHRLIKRDLAIGLVISAGGAAAILIAKGAWKPGEGLPTLPSRAALVAFHNAVFPIYKTLVPLRLGYYEPRYPFDVFAPMYVVFGLMAIFAGVYVWRKRTERPGLAVATASYLCLLAPMLGIVPFGYEVVADRFGFLPMLVWSVALALPATELRWSLAARRAVPALVLGALAILTWENTKHWKSSQTFWEHNYDIDPDSGMANSGMGDLRLKQDRIDDAERFYKRARDLQPEYTPTLLGLAFVDLRRDRFEEAIPKLENYLAGHPENRSARKWLSQAYDAVGRKADAEELRSQLGDEK